MSWEIAVITGCFGGSFMTAYIANQIAEKHNPIKFLLIMLSLLFIEVMLYSGWQIANLNDSNIATVMKGIFIGWTWVFSFLILYFMVEFVIVIIDLFRPNSKSDRRFV